MSCTLEGMSNLCDINSPVQIGTGEAVKCNKLGDKRIRLVQEDGSMKDITLKNCKYVPDLFTNLFSITKALENGWSICNEGLKIKFDKGNFGFTFDRTLRTESGAIMAVEMYPWVDTMNITLEPGMSMNINKLHLLLGHACKQTLRNMAHQYGITLKGNFLVCSDCAMSKARQKNVDKVTETFSTYPGERLFIDISSTRATSFGGSKFWLLIVDQFTDMCCSAFLEKKSELSNRVWHFIQQIKNNCAIEIENLHVGPITIRCDNAGENVALQKFFESKGVNVVFEYTPPGSPQFNGVVERKFKTLYERVRSLLNSARLSKDLREGLWTEAANYATDVENSIVPVRKTQSGGPSFIIQIIPSFEIFVNLVKLQSLKIGLLVECDQS
jgi:hypothetical protein